jgi:hypothetical protein
MPSVRHIHRDANILANFLRGVVMSDTTQKSDGAISATNSKFDVVIRPALIAFSSCALMAPFVFRKNRTVIAVEWNRALAGIEAVEASVFVR